MTTIIVCLVSFIVGAVVWHLIGRNNPKLRAKGDAVADRVEEAWKERRGDS